MPIFITGGTGFLGVNLVRLLLSQGQRVRLLVRSKPSRLGLESDLIEFVRGDTTDPASLMDAMRGCDQVYHVAGWVNITSWGMALARKTNVEGTRNVCATALQLGVRRLVHTSSIAAIGAGTPDRPADEDTPWDLHWTGIPYYITKRESESVVQDFVRRGLDAVIVNPSYLVGPWDVKLGAGRALLHVARGHVRIVPGAGGTNFADVRQAAAGHVLAMERGRTGQRYFLGGENLTFRAFCTRAAAIAGVKPPRVALPYGVMYPFAAAGSILGHWMPQRFQDFNLGLLRSTFLEHYATSRKACEELEYEEKSVEQAIVDGLAWFAEHGYLRRPA